jgi:cation transport ATPase
MRSKRQNRFAVGTTGTLTRKKSEVNDRTWQDEAFAFFPEIESKISHDVLNALQLQAQEYRERNKLKADTHLEVNVPERVAREAIIEHGSLRAAADSVFNPGSVTIFCQEWRDLRDKVNSLFQTGPAPFRVANLNELLRIAVMYGR